MITKYRKKPELLLISCVDECIEAIQYVDGYENKKEIDEFVGKPLRYVVPECYESVVNDRRLILEYWEFKAFPHRVIVEKGDYIVKENGTFYPCTPGIFEQTYERVE